MNRNRDNVNQGFLLPRDVNDSGTCSVDLDDFAKCVEIFNARGIDLNALCINNVGILSGKPNHYKLLFKLDKPLQTKKIIIDKNTILEFRCMTSDGSLYLYQLVSHLTSYLSRPNWY
jgi:hypothetical protein